MYKHEEVFEKEEVFEEDALFEKEFTFAGKKETPKTFTFSPTGEEIEEIIKEDEREEIIEEQESRHIEYLDIPY